MDCPNGQSRIPHGLGICECPTGPALRSLLGLWVAAWAWGRQGVRGVQADSPARLLSEGAGQGHQEHQDYTGWGQHTTQEERLPASAGVPAALTLADRLLHRTLHAQTLTCTFTIPELRVYTPLGQILSSQ